MIQIPDKYKLFLLAISLTTCSLTYFFSRNLSNIKQMSPPIDRYCHSIQQKLKRCKKDEASFECREMQADLDDCREAILSAYKEINIRCLGYSVQVQLCASDCLGESSEDSQDENGGGCSCGEKADLLKNCERIYVAKEIRAYGLQDVVTVDY
jgi:hypothetical protein